MDDQPNNTKGAKVLVRCLGPIREEHQFLSTNRIYDRICPKCRERMASMNVSRQCEKPQRGGGELETER